MLFTNGPELFDNTYQRYLLKTFRDHLPFKDVPIKLYLRHKRRSEQEPAEVIERDPAQETVKEAPPPKKRRKKAAADLSSLEFRTDVTDEEVEREGKHYDSELWKDL